MAKKKKSDTSAKSESPITPSQNISVPVELVDGLLSASHRGARNEIIEIASEFEKLAKAQAPEQFPE